jgi:serpin B
VKGTLADACTEINPISQRRDLQANTFWIEITTTRDPDAICTQALVDFTETVVLDVLDLPAGTYTVDVNGVSATFTLDVDNTAPGGTTSNIDTNLVAGNSAFAFDFYHAIRETEGNLFVSPYSISSALAMVYAGARGETEQQIADTFHYNLPQDQLHAAFYALNDDLSNDSTKEAFQLSIANSLWGQEGYPFLAEYLDLIAANYKADLNIVDFGGATEQARQRINDWVREETEDKIKELFAKGTISSDTRLVLANAIYFKAEWETPFLVGTEDSTFYLIDGSQVTVPMMSRRASTRYVVGDGYQAMELPYKGERTSMVIFLPDEGRFEELEQGLSSEQIEAVLHTMDSTDVMLYMPKFEYETALELNDTLAAMGMPSAFISGQADFSGINGARSLFISYVVHKAFVAVDEMGTEAAAATGVAMAESMPTVVRADHPFVFFIRDMQSGTILFVGRMLNPAAK